MIVTTMIVTSIVSRVVSTMGLLIFQNS